MKVAVSNVSSGNHACRDFVRFKPVSLPWHLHPRHAQRCQVRNPQLVRSLHHHAEALEQLVAQPAFDLIMRSANDVIGHELHTATTLAQGAIEQALNVGMTVADGLQVAGATEAGIATVTSLATDATLVASLPVEMQGIATWALDHLAVVQTIDPMAYKSLTTSLHSLLEGLQATLAVNGAATGELAASSWTNSLVLSVQQLVTTLRTAGASGFTVDSMLAAQEAMNVAMAGAAAEMAGATRTATALAGSAAVAGEVPMGLNGLLQFVLALIAMIVATIPRGTGRASDADDVPVPQRYDIPALNAYFAKRSGQVLLRNSEVVGRLSSFVLVILADWRLGTWEANIKLRATTIKQIVEDLGPAYIKIAQAVSTRVDILPEDYINAFACLQDNVKTFSTVEARDVLEEGLQVPVESVFEWLSEEPIAAASLGQVYRGKLRPEHGGAEVAVKVQRPGALESVAMDIFIMRRTAVMMSHVPGMSDKWAQALDDWAERFFQEMDYQLEAHNTITFKQHMAGLQGIKVATVFPQFTSRKVIITEWIEGERLANSKTEDIRALCGTLLNCYLIQLLETGLLHADPHPGNLMRTPDGKIVVLDFGLMTEVTEDQRIALVEYIAHLSVEDWEGVANDLVHLGFMPDGMPLNAAPQIAPIMQKVMGQLVKGGGLKNGFSITNVATELSGVAFSYKLCIPPYFALVLRAFSVIEGIALKVDPNYAIVQECMPYMSRRLLTDNNPRMRAALKQLLYGNGTRLNVERLQKMVGQFTSFTTAAQPNADERLTSGPTFSSAYSAAAAMDDPDGLQLFNERPILTESVKEVIKVVFSKDGSYAQEILVDEAVAAIDAMSRQGLQEALRMVTGTLATVAALRGVEALGPLRSMLMPLPLPNPNDIISTMRPAVTLTPEDKQALTTLRAVLQMVTPGQGSSPDFAKMGVRAVRVAGEVAPMLPELLPGMQATLELFARQLVRRMALRLAEDLDTMPKNNIVPTNSASITATQQQQPSQTTAQRPPNRS